MNKTISPRLVALTFGILVVCFSFAFYVIAWQEPSQTPPGGNVATPLNTGSTDQSKVGGLILNTGGAENGLVIDKGNLCLGTNCISSWTEAGGNIITYRMEASGYQSGNSYYGKTVSYSCPVGSSVVSTYCKQNMVTIGAYYWPTGSWDTAQVDSCSCTVTDSSATLKAKVIQGILYPGVYYYIGLVDYCTPGSVFYETIYCSVLPPPQCVMEFQCGTKQTVGQ